tara:strand:+ start:239 stop:391 length:153 start_codon:yes stop_codon:yes gene_type:complete
MKWDLEELKKALLDSAEDYDRIVENMNEDDNATFTRESKSDHESKKPSEE